MLMTYNIKNNGGHGADDENHRRWRWQSKQPYSNHIQIGKTCLITKFVKNLFLEEYKKTLGVDFLQKKHFIKELSEEVEFYIWDTAGQEEYNSLTRRYYKGASACIIAFSTTDRESFNHVEKWKKAVEEECGTIPMLLVQTKIDLIEYSAVTDPEIEELAKSLHMPILRVCSKDGRMINELFEFLALKYFSKDVHKQEDQAKVNVAAADEVKKEAIASGQAAQVKGIKLGAQNTQNEENTQKKGKWFSRCSVL